MFLHSQDRSYNILEFHEFIEKQGLKFIDCAAEPDLRGSHKLEINSYFKPGELKQKLSRFEIKKKQYLAELMDNTMPMHVIYAGNTIPKKPSPYDLDMIPSIDLGYDLPEEQCYIKIREAIEDCINKNSNIFLQEYYTPFKKRMFLKSTPHLLYFFKYIDSHKSSEEIFELIRGDVGETANNDVLSKEFSILYQILSIHSWITLRHRSIPYFKNPRELQSKL